MSVRRAQSVHSGAVRKVVLIPARPAGLPAAARTALLVPALTAPLPVRPGGAPRKQVDRRVASADFSNLICFLLDLSLAYCITGLFSIE